MQYCYYYFIIIISLKLHLHEPPMSRVDQTGAIYLQYLSIKGSNETAAMVRS